MRIFVIGGTGFVGRSLAPALVRGGHQVTVLTRSGAEEIPGVEWVKGDPSRKGGWQGPVREYDAIINLAGSPIFGRWTKKAKGLIRESRLLSTRNTVEALDGGSVKHLFNASGVGYYGFRGDDSLNENSLPGNDFLAHMARDWENEAKAAEKKGCRVVLTRFGIVLGEEGGVLGRMVPLFRKYLGGPLGRGQQWLSWIHMYDLTRAFLFLLKHPEISGPVNFTAPNPVRNEEFARSLGDALDRPNSFRVPAFLLKIILGEFGSALLEGQKVEPQVLLQSGFQFRYPQIEEALQQILVAGAKGKERLVAA